MTDKKRIYFYKLTTDNGGAPHVRDGLLSLAICKPMIRRTANVGDLILGFAADSLHADNRLVYVARVTGKVGGGDYYTRPYAERGDCIYERRDEHFVWRDGARYHGPADLIHDLGDHPEYPRANVLLSDEFSYFGGQGSADYKVRHPAVGDAVEHLGRGHRVEHPAMLRARLEDLALEVLREPRGASGAPSSSSACGGCHRDDDVCAVDDDEVQTHC